jgi:DNA-binding response OmpR family regulator
MHTADQELVSLVVIAPPSPMRAEVLELIDAQGWRWTPVDPIDLGTVALDAITTHGIVLIGAESITTDILRTVVTFGRDPETLLMVVAKDRDPIHIADILRAGADDYLVHPFEPAEFLVRVRMLASYAERIRSRQREIRPMIDPKLQAVFDGERYAVLSDREFDIVTALLDASGRSVSRRELSITLWGDPGHETAVASIISRLRAKLEAQGIQSLDLQTVRGRGYLLRLSQLNYLNGGSSASAGKRSTPLTPQW